MSGSGSPAASGQALARPKGRAAPPLGMITKYPSIAPQSHAEKAKEEQQARRDAALARRYDLRDCARQILPRERVSLCGRLVVPTKSAVQVWYDPEHEAAHFGQLVTCGSIWHCPVCAAKIAERRRVEVKEAMTTWRERGGLIALATFTLSHHAGESLGPVLARLQKARDRLLSGRAAVSFKAEHGIVGSIRALEITHGVNGWHPHLHVLLFISPEKNTCVGDTDYLVRDLKASWSAAVAKEDGQATWAHGCDVQTNSGEISDVTEKLANYFTKQGGEWDESHELTKSNAKQGIRAGRSPMQLLIEASKGDSAAGRLWLQYACTMKGERFLYWSRGLRDLLGLNDEQSDEELAESTVASAVLVVEIGKAAWQYVLGNAARADLLIAARKGGYEGVCAMLADLGVPDEHIPLWPDYKPPTLEDH